MGFLALLPLGCATTSFILGLLCMFAGSSPGFMEDYHIMAVSWSIPFLKTMANGFQLNTSTLGHNLIDAVETASTSSSNPTSIGSWFTGILQNVTYTIENDLTGLENDLVDKLAAEFGIK